MSRTKLGMASLEINKQFKNEDEAYKYAKRLKEYIRYICNKNADKKYMGQALIVISNTKRNVSQLKNVSNGKKGRPRTKLIIDEVFVNKFYGGNYNTNWHIHILLVSSPSYYFRDLIKNYVDKNWGKVKVHKKNCNIKIVDYFINQSSKRLFCNYNCEELTYSLKDYYKEYLKLDKEKIKLYRMQSKLGEDKYFSELEKIESKFKEIEEYFLSITKEQDNKKLRQYIDKVRCRLIAEKYIKLQNKS